MPHTNGEPTLHELYDGMARECAMWREQTVRLRLTASELEAIERCRQAAANVGMFLEAGVVRSLLARISQ